MRVRRAHHHRIGLAGQADIVAIAPVAGQEAQILAAPDRLSNARSGRRSVHQASTPARVIASAAKQSSARLAQAPRDCFVAALLAMTALTTPGTTGSICPRRGCRSPYSPGSPAASDR